MGQRGWGIVGAVASWARPAYRVMRAVLDVLALPGDADLWRTIIGAVRDALTWEDAGLLATGMVCLILALRAKRPDDLRAVRDLLREAAQWIVEVEPQDKTARKEHLAFLIRDRQRVYNFLDEAFVRSYHAEAHDYVKRRGETGEALAEYLTRLASRITAEDVDPDFRLPAWFRAYKPDGRAEPARPALPGKAQIEEWIAFVNAYRWGWVETGAVAALDLFERTIKYEPEWVEMRPFLAEETVRQVEVRTPGGPLLENPRVRSAHLKRLVTRDLRVLLRKVDG